MSWFSIKLRELGEFKNGANYPKGSYGEGTKIVNVKDLFRGRYVSYGDLDELRPNALKDKSIYLVSHGDLLFTRSSLVKSGAGMVAMINKPIEEVLFCGFIIRFRPIMEKVSPLFLLYLLRSPSYRKLFTDSSVQTNISNINQETLGNIEVTIPSLIEQERIIVLLDSIDSKIELNNRINAELEAMAKTIYDYWFVQFDFPFDFSQGKPPKNGRRSEPAELKPYKSSGGKMVWNEELKREIPEGWEVKRLGDYAGIKKGTLITEKTANTNGSIKVVSAGIDFSYFHSESNYPENTITISASGASAGFINFWREPIFACDCTTIRGRTTSDTLQILGFLQMRQDFIYSQARGSAQPHVYPKDIEGLLYVVPPSSLVERLGDILVPGNEKVAVNLKENQQLAYLRDWLLPMLMNGQVTVKDEAKA
jgi:type I restriction enzyme S subunit